MASWNNNPILRYTHPIGDSAIERNEEEEEEEELPGLVLCSLQDVLHFSWHWRLLFFLLLPMSIAYEKVSRNSIGITVHLICNAFLRHVSKGCKHLVSPYKQITKEQHTFKHASNGGEVRNVCWTGTSPAYRRVPQQNLKPRYNYGPQTSGSDRKQALLSPLPEIKVSHAR